MEEASRGSVLSELKELVKNLRNMAKTPHVEDVAGVDATLETALMNAEAVANNAQATVETLRAACKTTRQAGMDFLASVTPKNVDEPFDITFFIADAAITTGQGWSTARTVAESTIEFYEMTFDFNQVIDGLPAGTYDLRVQAFNRPGEKAAVCADYQAGQNDVVAYLYAGRNEMKICHLAEGASATKLHDDDYAAASQAYVPNTMASSAAHFAKGYYDNSLLFNLTTATNLQLGVRQSVSAAYYWTILDNFRLYYYGSMTIDMVTDVETVVVEDAESRAAVYNIHGQKVGDSLDGLPRGLYICNGKKVLVK